MRTRMRKVCQLLPRLLLLLCAIVLVMKLLEGRPRCLAPATTNNLNLTSGTAPVTPLILIYNDSTFWGNWGHYFYVLSESNAIRTTRHCPTECHYTFDKYFQRMADFVLISLGRYDDFYGTKPNLTFTKENQLWTAYHFDPPPHISGQGYTLVDDHFHWTANYRRDADIYLPFGRFYPKSESQNDDVSLDDIRSSLRKKKLVSWLVSNCGDFEDAKARLLLAESLKRFIPVDIYGKCSGRQCPPTTGQPYCQRYLGQNYKFYLAFENSLCVDYVTEKFFMSFENGMVPVVFGWADYSLYAPAGSYINALSYDTVENLAEYLLYLDQNDDEYLKYFSWTASFSVEAYTNQHICLICQSMWVYLNQNRSAGEPVAVQKVQKYSSYREWFESFPAGRKTESSTFRLAGRSLFNTTKACVKYDEHPELLRWLRGESWAKA